MSDLKNITQFLSNTGKRHLALDVINHFASRAVEPVQFKDVADAYLYSFDFDKSLEYFQIILKSNITDGQKTEIILNIANVYLIKNNPKESLNVLKNLPDMPEVVRLRKDAIIMQDQLNYVSETGYWMSDISEKHMFSVELANWLVSYLEKTKRTYDFGCGIGYYLDHLKKNNFTDLVGYEGVVPQNQIFENIKSQDFTKQFDIEKKGNVICLEVGEHIPAQYQNIFLDNVTNACDNILVLSWSIRGQLGLFHVNCLNNDEVIHEVEKRGFVFLNNDSWTARKSIGTACDWFKNTILIFKKK